MVFFAIVLDRYHEKDGQLTINEFFHRIKRNTWVYKNEKLANKQFRQLCKSIPTAYEFKIVRFEMTSYRSIDLLGEIKMRKNRVKNYQLIRPCLTHNYLPEQIVDPQLKRGKNELYVFNFNRSYSDAVERSPLAKPDEQFVGESDEKSA